MGNIKLTARLTDMLTETGAATLLNIITATQSFGTGGRPVKHWSVDWETGKVFTSDQFQAGTDAEGLPEIVSVCVSATIPAHMILTRNCREHQLVCLHMGEVWSIEDLAYHDLRTFQILEYSCNIHTCHRVWNRMRTECAERFRQFSSAPDPFLSGQG